MPVLPYRAVIVTPLTAGVLNWRIDDANGTTVVPATNNFLGANAPNDVIRTFLQEAVAWKMSQDSSFAANTTFNESEIANPLANPIQTGCISCRNDFIFTVGGSAENWAPFNIVAAVTMNVMAGTFTNPGIVQLQTGTTSGNGGVLRPGNTGTANACLGPLGSNAGWDSTFIFRIGSTAAITYRIGYMPSAATSDPPTDGIWLRYDTNASDAAFKFETRAASSSTVHANTFTVDTNFHKLRIRSVTAGTIGLTFDGNGEITQAVTVPSVSLGPAFQVITRTTAAKTADLDLWTYYANISR